MRCWLMSQLGQTRKSSLRGYVFRFAPESGHRALQSACLFRGRFGLSYLFGGDFGGATEAAKGSRGSDPRLLGLTMGWILDRTVGGRPRASRIVNALGLDQPS